MNPRHSPTTGRFLPKRIAAAVPLFVAQPKSAPHVAGHVTRRAKWTALRDDRTAKLRAGQ